MNAQEHYAQAQRLVDRIQNPTRAYLDTLTDDPTGLEHDLALAQVHAHLAIAAAIGTLTALLTDTPLAQLE